MAAASISAKHDPKRRRTLDPVGRYLKHDPEKWIPVFGQDHAQTKILDYDPIQLNWIIV
jgi:hypothetical protein